jgi:enediyne biosynthesis protein E3
MMKSKVEPAERALSLGSVCARSPDRASFFRFLQLDLREASFHRRGFPDTPARERLERAGRTFIRGYNLAAVDPRPETVLPALADISRDLRGFFAEGAAMGAALRSLLLPWRHEFRRAMRALCGDYPHLAHVGVGWAMARVPFARHRLARALDPLLAPLAIDGRGFHDGYFSSRAVVAGRGRPSGLTGRIWDQGVGRSFWFSQGANPDRLAAAVARLAPARRDDLWAGIGLACVYAGGASPAAIGRLTEAAGPSLRWMRQGAAFAIAAHARAGAVPAEAAAAAGQLCRLDTAALVELVNKAQSRTFKTETPQPIGYQAWRSLVADGLERGAA